MAREHLSSFPILQTNRLLLRRLVQDDAGEIFMLRSDEDVNRYLGRKRAENIADAKAFIEKIDGIVNSSDGFFWAVTPRDESSLAGTICFWNIDREKNKAELGYELLPAYQGKGIMTEAIAAVLRFGFDQLGFTSIEAWTHPGNLRSSALLEKAGFKRDHAAEAHKPADAPEMIYSLTATGY